MSVETSTGTARNWQRTKTILRGERFEESMEAMSWDEICNRHEFRGRWVALAGCRYDHVSARPIGGTVVDVDDDLVELCSRMREAGRSSCSILFCEVPEEVDPMESHPSRRSGMRAVAH